MMMRRVVLLVLVLVSISASAVTAQEMAVAPMACDEPGSLTMWVWDENWAEVISASIEEWTTDYCPGAEVELVVQPWGQYWDLLATNATSGDLPDVFNMSQDRFFFYASNDALLNLESYLDAAGIDQAVWGAGMIDPYRWGDANDLYAAPVNWDTVAVYYNKDLFDAAGVTYPTSEWTWDDFAATAAALTDPANDVYGAAVYSEYQAGYANFIASTGIPPAVGAGRTQCTLDDPASIEALSFLKGMYDEGYMPSVSIMGGASADDSFNFWLAGRVAMVSGGSWKLPAALEQATFNWDVVELPLNPDTNRSRSMLHAVGYVAAANTPMPDLAANLIIFLASDVGQRYFAEAGGVAPANPALQDTWIASFGDAGVNIQAFVNAIDDSQGVTVFGEIWNTINTELTINIFDLNLSVEEATAQACGVIEQYLN